MKRLSLAQYARFLAVGGAVGIATVAARELLQRLLGGDTPWHYSISVVAAYALGIIMSFALNLRFTFATDRAPGAETAATRASWWTFLRFAVLAVVGLGCTWLLSLALRYGLPTGELLGRAGPSAAFAAAALLSTAITYPLNARYVFRERASGRRAGDCWSSRRVARPSRAAQ